MAIYCFSDTIENLNILMNKVSEISIFKDNKIFGDFTVMKPNEYTIDYVRDTNGKIKLIHERNIKNYLSTAIYKSIDFDIIVIDYHAENNLLTAIAECLKIMGKTVLYF